MNYEILYDVIESLVVISIAFIVFVAIFGYLYFSFISYRDLKEMGYTHNEIMKYWGTDNERL